MKQPVRTACPSLFFYSKAQSTSCTTVHPQRLGMRFFFRVVTHPASGPLFTSSASSASSSKAKRKRATPINAPRAHFRPSVLCVGQCGARIYFVYLHYSHSHLVLEIKLQNYSEGVGVPDFHDAIHPAGHEQTRVYWVPYRAREGSDRAFVGERVRVVGG